MRNKKNFFLILVAALALAIYWANARRSLKNSGTSENLSHSFSPQEVRVFDFNYRLQSKTSFFQFFPKAASSNSDYQFDWNVNGKINLKRISNVQDVALIEIKNKNTAGAIELNDTEIALPFYINYDTNRAITNFEFNKQMPEMARAFVKNIMLAQVVSYPETGPRDFATDFKWNAKESDGNGPFQVDYQIKQTDDKGFTVVKNNKLYSNEDDKRPAVKIQTDFKKEIRSELSLQAKLELSGNILSLSSKETVNITLDKGKLAEYTQELSLNKSSDSVDRRLMTDQIKSDLNSENIYSSNLEKGEMARARAELKDLDPKDLLAQFKKASALKSRDEVDALYLKMKALLYLYPNWAHEIEKMMKTLDNKSWGYQTLLRALGATGNEVCQEVIMSLIDQNQNEQNKTRLILELGNLRNPTEKTETFLRNLVQNSDSPRVTETAGLTLGMMAYRLASTDQTREEKIVSDLMGDLQDVENKAQKNLIISALGNSGSKMAEEKLLEIASNPKEDAQSREESIRSLRFVPGSEITKKLADFLNSSDQKTQEAALFALSFRTPDATASAMQKKLYGQTSSTIVKTTIIQNLLDEENQNNSREWLMSQLNNEKDPEVIKFLKSKLNL